MMLHGHYRDVLKDVTCDALIVDPPYSDRTHKGSKTDSKDGYARNPVNYTAWGEGDIDAFVDFWSERNRGWWAIMTDHVLAPLWERALRFLADLYVFAPIPCIVKGSRVRLAGDGPSNWTVWLIVARPRTREFSRWGTLPGAYITGSGTYLERGPARIGGKPLHLMRSIVRDYSRKGDLVCDPCAGHGTTLLAARSLGRQCIGADIDEHCVETYNARVGDTPIETAIETWSQESLI